MKITIVGTGYVGLVTGACFSEIGHNVLCVDKDERKVGKLKQGVLPIYEDGLQEIVDRNVAEGRLSFSTSIAEGTTFAEVVFIAVGTPPGYHGEANMSYVEQVGRQVAENMDGYKLLVEKSTVPVNTGGQLKRTMSKNLQSGIDFDVASNPEFLREGCAVVDTFNPDRIVIGVENDRAASLLKKIYDPIVKKSGCQFLQMNIASAELTKHASNSFLAMKISFVNAVARVCELAGADIEQVTHGMGLDQRIGSRFLNAGVGYGGSCFPKDVDAFIHIADQLGYNFQLLKQVQEINRSQRDHIFKMIQQELWVIQDKSIAVFGLAFKPGTDDIRHAPSLDFVPKLLDNKARLRLWDPIAKERFAEKHPGLDYAETPMECAKGADLVLILTDWPELRDMDLEQLKAVMNVPVIVDGRNMFDPMTMKKIGFTYRCAGRA